MSGYAYDPRASTVVINGVRVDMEGVSVTFPLVGEARRSAEAAPSIVSRDATGYAARGSVEIALTEEQVAAFLRMIRSPWLRGCFHDGCDAAEGEEGGSHWCRWAP